MPSRTRPPRSPDSDTDRPRPGAAYLDAVRMLARRDLSEAQLRQRLARKGHERDVVEAAIDRLRAERAVDDERVAERMAHAQASGRLRGKLRVRMEIERAGIDRATARRAVDAVFTGAVDDAALLDAALAKRLRGRDRLTDESEMARVFRYLVGQGFAPDLVLERLKRYRVADSER
jgi:regulatory protein